MKNLTEVISDDTGDQGCHNGRDISTKIIEEIVNEAAGINEEISDDTGDQGCYNGRDISTKIIEEIVHEAAGINEEISDDTGGQGYYYGKDISTKINDEILYETAGRNSLPERDETPKSFDFTSFADLKAKLRSLELLPYSQFPLTQRIETEEKVKRKNEEQIIIVDGDIATTCKRPRIEKGLGTTDKFQFASLQSRSEPEMESKCKGTGAEDIPKIQIKQETSGKEMHNCKGSDEKEMIELTQFDSNQHSFSGLAMPSFSNKAPRVGLSRLEKVKPLHLYCVVKKDLGIQNEPEKTKAQFKYNQEFMDLLEE